MQRSGMLVCLMIFVTLILTGCFQGEQSLEEIDAPRDAEAVNHSESEEKSDDPEKETKEDTESFETETGAREIDLIDVNGMVVSQTLELPNPDSKEVATQVLEYLVKDGPVASILPNGFQAILPAGTEVLGLNLQEDGTLIVDVSKEFENYNAEDELKVLQSMTYTLTQFENVDKIHLWINGHPQSEMPVNGTPIEEGYSRTNGINIIETDTLDLLNSNAVTMYYPAEYNENRYYVPVTQHIVKEDDSVFGPIVQALLDGPGYNMNVTHVFNTQTSLVSTPTLEEGILKLVFSQEILKDIDGKIISDEVMETLVRTLTEQSEVEALEIEVENIDKLTNENGEVYNEPVTNKAFMPHEKL